jgi:glycerol-3-phosphate dehydrogenase
MDGEAYSLADLAYLAEKEDAETLIDVLYRRTPLGWRPRIDRSSLKRSAESVGAALGWSNQRLEDEIGNFTSYALERHLIKIE